MGVNIWGTGLEEGTENVFLNVVDDFWWISDKTISFTLGSFPNLGHCLALENTTRQKPYLGVIEVTHVALNDVVLKYSGK